MANHRHHQQVADGQSVGKNAAIAAIVAVAGLFTSIPASAESGSYEMQAKCTTPARSYTALGLVSAGPTYLGNGVNNNYVTVTTTGQGQSIQATPLYTGLLITGTLTLQNGSAMLIGLFQCDDLVRLDADGQGGQRPIVTGFRRDGTTLTVPAGGRGVLSDQGAMLEVTFTPITR